MDIILIGDSGHAKVIADMVFSNGDQVIARLDDKYKNSFINKDCWIGPISDIETLMEKNHAQIIIAIGSNPIRKKIVERLSLDKEFYATVVHKTAVISPSVTLGEGTVIMPGVVINAEAKIGRHSILNSSSVIEHDCIIEDFVHVSPGAVLTGGVIIDKGVHIGANATVIPLKQIGQWSTIGAGSVVLEDIQEQVVAVGVPARVIKKTTKLTKH